MKSRSTLSAVSPGSQFIASLTLGSASRAMSQWRLMSSTLGPERPKWVQSVLPVNAQIRLPLAAERMISAGSVSPENSVIQWRWGRTSGTSAGTIGAVSEWPRLVASAKPPPSEPDLGNDFPPVQRMIRLAAIAAVSVVT